MNEPSSSPVGTSPGAKTAPRFSVIMPTFNYAQYIRRAIESVLAQPGDDYEMLVVDDGSTDSTSQIVSEFFPRVGYLRQDNRGTYAACLHGIRKTTGDYLIFLDADDRLLPGALDRVRRVLSERPEMRMIFGRNFTVMPDGTRRQKTLPPLGKPMDNFRRFIRGKLRGVSAGGAVIHRDVLLPLCEATSFFHGMDIVAIGLGLARFPCCRIDEPLAEIYVHAGRLRDNIESIERAGLQAVPALFDPSLLPPEAMRYRGQFVGWLQRSRTRSFYRAGRYGEAVRCYLSAVKADWRSLGDLRSLRRFVLGLLGACSFHLFRSR